MSGSNLGPDADAWGLGPALRHEQLDVLIASATELDLYGGGRRDIVLRYVPRAVSARLPDHRSRFEQITSDLFQLNQDPGMLLLWLRGALALEPRLLPGATSAYGPDIVTIGSALSPAQSRARARSAEHQWVGLHMLGLFALAAGTVDAVWDVAPFVDATHAWGLGIALFMLARWPGIDARFALADLAGKASPK